MSGINADLRGIAQAQSPKQGIANTVAEAGRQEGAIKGQAAVVINQTASLADAAEEVGFAAAEKVEKKLAERKAGSKEGMRLSMTELAMRFVNMTGDSQAPKKLQEFVESLKNLGGQVTQDQIKQLLGESFQDVAEQYAALEYAEAALEEEGQTPELLNQVKATKDALLKESGPSIRAGINIASDVLNFSRKGLAEIGPLRELYGFAVLGAASAGQMYKAVMERYGESRFEEALDFLLSAAGSDLDSVGGMGPSQDAVHLEAAVNNVSFVQHLGNLYVELNDLIERVSPGHA